MFIKLVICLSIVSTALGTSDLLTSLSGADPVRLPTVVPGSALESVPPSAPKVESFLDKLAAPFAFLQGGLPCLGATSLKPGNCKIFDSCAAEGGFEDGKGLCLGGASCCVKPIKCGEFSLLNNTVLANPNFPKSTVETGSCVVKLVKPLGISHVKLLIEDLELAKPDHVTGKCDVDSFTVTGGVLPGFGIGKLCGINSKTHIYVPTVLELADIFIKIELADEASIQRRWLIRAEMIEFKSPEKPPVGCAQYFRESSGLVTSFNFDLSNGTGLGNIDGLKYGICFNPGHGSCSIKFNQIFFNLGGKISSHSMGSPSIPSRVSRAAPSAGYRPSPPQYRPQATYNPNRPYGLHAPSNGLSGQFRPYSPYGPKLRPQGGYIPAKNRLPVYHRPSLIEAQHFPYSPFLFRLPYGAISPFVNRPMGMYPTANMFNGQYNAPMKKPDVDVAKLDDKFDKLDKEGLLNKLEDKFGDKLGDKLGLNELSLPRVCPNQDTVIFPIPDDGTSPIHCGNEFHFGGELISSIPPFMITVANKGEHHGKGFAVSYKVQC